MIYYTSIIVFYGSISKYYSNVKKNNLALMGGSGGPGHSSPGADDECIRCHITGNENGERLWARELTDTTFAGVRQLCYSCHDGSVAISGIYTVFDPASSEDHVMHDWASIQGSSVVAYNQSIFPLDEDDQWNYPKCDDERCPGDSVNYGFYCGSCHDVHRQPRPPNYNSGSPVVDGNGDYLRIKTSIVTHYDPSEPWKNYQGNLGTESYRLDYCRQCHLYKLEVPNLFDRNNQGDRRHGTYYNRGCLDCHHPHEGATMISDNNRIGQLILDEAPTPYSVLPNIILPNTVCIRCKHSQAGYTGNSCEHHPMGDKANLDPATSHAPSAYLYTDYLTCNVCHDVHNNEFKDSARSGTAQYMDPALADIYAETDPRWDAGQSNFCTHCHTNKSINGLVVNLSPGCTGHNLDCGDCHYVHWGLSIPYATFQTTDAGANDTNSAACADLFLRFDFERPDWVTSTLSRKFCTS